MYKFAALPTEDKKEVFQSVSVRMGLRPEIIEKDYWVCFLLKHIFHDCQYKDSFVFKGGTSLSKAYHAIKRFSEDIDLIFDWTWFVAQGEDPWEARSRTQQDKFNKKLNEKAAEFYKNELVVKLNSELKSILKEDNLVSVDDEDMMVVNFYYPQIFEADYIRNKIRLEIGPLAERLPSHYTRVEPYVAEYYPQLFEKSSTDILTVDAERTFWEKLTILNKLAHYPESKQLPPRYARHLYDVYCMANSPIKASAFERKDLLEKDVRFKQKFYYSKGAHYEDATLSQISLLPVNHIVESVKADYAAMRNMIYGDYPSFEEIIMTLENLEKDIHNLE